MILHINSSNQKIKITVRTLLKDGLLYSKVKVLKTKVKSFASIVLKKIMLIMKEKKN